MEAVAKEAEVEKLAPLGDLFLIDRYARAYGQLPRVVQQEPFDEFIPILWAWKERDEYDNRVAEARKKLTPKPNGNT